MVSVPDKGTAYWMDAKHQAIYRWNSKKLLLVCLIRTSLIGYAAFL